jgi:phosphoglycerate dehydrogenase-like enzyme
MSTDTAGSGKLHLHLENLRAKPEVFHLTPERYAAAARKHPQLAERLTVTVGWDADILDQALKTADIMIGSKFPTANLASRAPRLKWLQTTGAGIEQLLPLDWLPQRVALVNNRGVHGAKAGEYAAMAVIMLNNRMPEIIASQREQKWQPIFTPPVAGRTALVIGLGDLGGAAARACNGLGLRVIGVSRSGRMVEGVHEAHRVDRLDELLPRADFVIVATPLTPQTRGLLDARRIDLMRHGAGFINIGRAAIADYAALQRRLESGELCGALVDVFEPEPLPAGSPLWKTRNLIATPHVSCDDPNYIALTFDAFFANLERFLAGKELHNRVDTAAGY